MSFDLYVDAPRWRKHLTTVAESTPGLVPVIKGNGYGLGRDVLAAEAARMDIPMIAVGTYAEVPDALAQFPGQVMVLSPWRPRADNRYGGPEYLDDRVVHTLGRIADIESFAAEQPGAQVVIEGQTSMSRHGLDRHQLAAAAAALGSLHLTGFAVHLPMEGSNLAEAEAWAAVLETSQLETTQFFVSHLSPSELTQLHERRPDVHIRPRIGTSLWLGDLGALDVRATVLDVHRVQRGERVGYRQRAVPQDGYLLIISGGTSHGIGMAAPRAATGLIQRGKEFAKGALAATGRTLSPFSVAGRQRWFAEPPHMQASMVLLPESAQAPQVGEAVPAAVRFTTTTFDRVIGLD